MHFLVLSYLLYRTSLFVFLHQLLATPTITPHHTFSSSLSITSLQELQLELEAERLRDGRRQRGEEHGAGDLVEPGVHAQAGDAVGAVQLFQEL